MSECFGILNITADSFSDGGDFLSSNQANQKALGLLQSGADWIEVSGQSSNVSAFLVEETEEWHRISSVLPLLKKEKAKISIDSFRPSVQKLALEYGVGCLNDISGFTHVDSKRVLQEDLMKHKTVALLVMHSHTLGIAKQNSNLTPSNVIAKIKAFFWDRKKELMDWGIQEHRIYFDPGMGFFLSDDPEVSFAVLRNIDSLLSEFPNLMVSVSRKSFLGNSVGGIPASEREFVTLAVEMYLLQKKVPWIRTHNVLKVKQAEKILQKLDLLSTRSDGLP
jgi:dihydropteroate synthase